MRTFHIQDAPKKRRRHLRKILKCALSQGRPTLHYLLVALRYFTEPGGMKHRTSSLLCSVFVYSFSPLRPSDEDDDMTGQGLVLLDKKDRYSLRNWKRRGQLSCPRSEAEWLLTYPVVERETMPILMKAL